LQDEIGKLALAGKMDVEIAIILKLPVKQVYHIRKFILKIYNWGRKRLCVKCGKMKPITLFWLKNPVVEIRDWCLVCRRKSGVARPYHKEKKPREKVMVKDGCIVTLCLRCDRSFNSELLADDNRTYNRLCLQCRNIVNASERVSIYEI